MNRVGDVFRVLNDDLAAFVSDGHRPTLAHTSSLNERCLRTCIYIVFVHLCSGFNICRRIRNARDGLDLRPRELSSKATSIVSRISAATTIDNVEVRTIFFPRPATYCPIGLGVHRGGWF